MRENGHRSHAFNKIENRARLPATLDLPTVYVSAGQLKVFRSPSGTARGTAAGEVSASAVSVRLRRGPGSAGALASVLRRKSRRIGRLFRNRQDALLVRGSQPGRCGVGTAGGLAGAGEGTAATAETCWARRRATPRRPSRPRDPPGRVRKPGILRARLGSHPGNSGAGRDRSLRSFRSEHPVSLLSDFLWPTRGGVAAPSRIPEGV